MLILGKTAFWYLTSRPEPGKVQRAQAQSPAVNTLVTKGIQLLHLLASPLPPTSAVRTNYQATIHPHNTIQTIVMSQAQSNDLKAFGGQCICLKEVSPATVYLQSHMYIYTPAHKGYVGSLHLVLLATLSEVNFILLPNKQHSCRSCCCCSISKLLTGSILFEEGL